MQEYNFIHSCIRVMDLEKSLDFYKGAFNLKESKRKDFPEDKFTLVYLTDAEENFELELTYNYDQEEPYTIGNGYSHIAVSVDDLETSHKEHIEAGYNVGELRSLSDSSSGYYFITDPDGYRVEVIGK
ncbi:MULTISPECIES: VOC family protein [unclassified Halanaerobium]|uniref:lactoylglutathione lyase n=1 Tax=unclassified Halanaerobium TaxID=2641197 RepID=UPI000DF1E8CD|nr:MULTISPECIES: VOC family protein [unclassified Halanaerobium]RCW48794.1 lactoylglutathione lyase [Halanaerobium sp. MA284_MarDTE_T2]RCW89136.1 lactoylglutathione lyase [Halanaerobium sp. DL-01]